MDIPYYLTDTTAVAAATGWRPLVSMAEVLEDIFRWLYDHRGELEMILN